MRRLTIQPCKASDLGEREDWQEGFRNRVDAWMDSLVGVIEAVDWVSSAKDEGLPVFTPGDFFNKESEMAEKYWFIPHARKPWHSL